MVTGWALVVSFNLVTAAAYLAIVVIIVLGLVRTRQLRRNRLAVATAAIFLTCAAHHVRHAFDLLGGSGADQLSMMRESMGSSLDVTVTAGTALAGAVYLGLRRSYGLLLRSPAMFDTTSEARYRQLAANLPHTVVLLFDPDLRFVLVEGAGLAADERRRLEGRLLRECGRKQRREQQVHLVIFQRVELAGEERAQLVAAHRVVRRENRACN